MNEVKLAMVLGFGAAEGEEESGGGESYQHRLLKLACTPVVLNNGGKLPKEQNCVKSEPRNLTMALRAEEGVVAQPSRAHAGKRK